MTVLRLRDDVFILPYDGHDESQRYVAGVDGRHFVISAGLAVLLDEMRAPATLESLAQRASDRTGISITAAELELLLRERVPPVLFQADSDPQPLLGPLSIRMFWLSADFLAPLLRTMRGLFTWRVALAVIATLLCVEVLIATQTQTVAPHEFSSRDTALGLMLTFAGMALHEIGHLAACHRFGVRHGGAGVGLYWCVPTVYVEVQGIWMMPRLQRAVVDVAGVYLQCAYLAALGTIYLCTESSAIFVALTWSHLLVLHALNPLLKLDGYWLLADLAGVHHLHRKIRDVVRAACHRVRPSGADLALVGAFTAGTCAYLAYLVNAFAHGLASVASAISLNDSGTAGRGVALSVCSLIILALAAVLARSLRSLFSKELP